MKKIIVASDSFKGSLSSIEIGAIFESQILKFNDKVKVIKIPIADGGEGTLSTISGYLNGIFINVNTYDSMMNPIISEYFIAKNVAYFELAKTAGFKDGLTPDKTTTYGAGIQIKDAIKRGAKQIVIGLGGSSTNDGGCGLMSALGTIYYDKQNKPFIPVGGTLKEIEHVDNSKTLDLLKDVSILCLSDVSNPMFGKTGAAYVFAPQKGADLAMVKELDKGLIHLNNVYKKEYGIDVSKIPGSGAAGATSASLIALGNAKITSGIDYLLELSNFSEEIKDADFVISGEGKLDSQSFDGKVLCGLMKRMCKSSAKLILFVGSMDEHILKPSSCEKIYVTNKHGKDFAKYAIDDYKNEIQKFLDDYFI